ncbi:MAG TPA: energy transducer TonB, partial [Vicinamibacterales bacterium]|nr:energy transducer TonB [Vicinamibacterales bacterium]
MRTLHFAAVLALLAPMGCRETPDKGDAGDPALLTRELPFVYPPALYAAKVEGEVGLRLFIDSLGLVVPESTTVAEPSGHPEFDSAAVAGAPYLEFMPARDAGARVGKTVVLPVKFRLPPADS